MNTKVAHYDGVEFRGLKEESATSWLISAKRALENNPPVGLRPDGTVFSPDKDIRNIMGATYAVGYMSQEERDADVRAYQLVSADSLPKDIVLPWVCGECDYLERHWLFIHNPRPAERTDEVAIRGLLLSPSAYVKTTEIGAEVRQDVSEILGTGNETT